MRFILTCMFVFWTSVASAQSADSDRDFITGLIEDTINSDDMTVRLINFQGALSATATADAITIADQGGIWLRLDDLTIEWDRSALLSGRVEISKLAAERIELIRLPLPETSATGLDLPNAEATPFSLPDLPVSIEISDISAGQIMLTEALLGEPVTARVLGNITLGGGEGSTDFTLERTDTKVGRFIVDADFSDTTRQLALMVLAEEGENGIAARLLNLPDRPAVRLDIAGDAPLDTFKADISLATDGVDRVTGIAQLSRPTGTFDRTFNLNLAGDLRPLLPSQFDDFFGSNTVMRVEGTSLETGGLRLSDLTIAADQVVLRGSARLDAQGWPEAIDLRGRLGSGDSTRVLLPFVSTPTEVSGMSLDVQYDAAVGDAWTGAFDITSLTRDGLSIDALALSGGGTITQGAGTNIGQFNADLNYAARGLALDDPALSEAIGEDIEGTIKFGRFEGAPLIISDLTLAGAGLSVQGNGQIMGPDERFQTSAKLFIDAEDFTRFAALSNIDLSGRGLVRLSGDIQPFDGVFDVNITARTNDLAIGIPQVDPLLLGASILSLRADRDTTGTHLRRIRLANAALIAEGSADLTSDSAQATFNADLNTLSILTPSLSGPATLQADVQTDAQGIVTLNTTLTAPQATAGVQGIASPTDGGYVLRGAGEVNVEDLSAYGDLVGERLGGGIAIDLNGTFSTLSQVLDADVTAQTRDLRAGTPVLDRVLAGLGRITANLSLSEARRLRLDALDVVFPNLTATGAIATSGTDTTANLSLRLRDVALLASEFSGPLLADLTARQDAGGWAVTAQADGPVGTNARATGRVSSTGLLDLNVIGSAPLALANLYIAPRQLRGLAEFNMNVNGPAALSSVRGPITISDARFAAPNLQQSIDDIRGSLLLAGGTARLDLRGAGGDGGTIALTGPIDLSPPFQAGLSADLSGIVLRDPTLYRTTANGRVTVNGPLAGGAVIAGTVNLDAVEVQVPSTGASALGPLPEVTHLGPRLEVRQTLDRAGVSLSPTVTQARTNTGADFPVDLLIRAPSRIFVRGRGLDAELGGQVRLTGSLNTLVPVGRFDLIRGRLSILGQRFDLDEGYAQLQGDFTPFLRLVASTTAQTGTSIRIIVEGPADEIDVSFESTPELPQDEVLAQLLFGRNLTSISPLQLVQLASAAATLAGTGGGGFVANIREGLDLDDLDIVIDEDGGAGVRAGKYISENVYTDVTIGGNGTSEINLNIDITDDVTARGTFGTDGETSVGIFFERDY